MVRPGFQTGPDQIVLSNTYAIAALIHDAGGEAMDCGIVRDDVAELGHAVRSAQAAGAAVRVSRSYLLLEHLYQRQRINPGAAEAHRPVEVWAGDAAGRA